MQLAASIIVGLLIATMVIFSLPLLEQRCRPTRVPPAKVLSPQPVLEPPVVSQSAPVVIVNEKEKAYLPAIGALGMGATLEVERRKAEALFSRKQYKKAIEHFLKALQTNPSDIRAQLGLGKAYVEVHSLDSAISQLSKVRNACREYELRGMKDNETWQVNPLPMSPPETFMELIGLPEYSRASIDYEARSALEKAVTARAGQVKETANGAYQNDRHYQVLKSCIALARVYHKTAELEEATAMYQLANENTRGLPASVITSCCARGNSDELWSQLSNLVLNALVDEERDWYLERLASIITDLAPDDIRRAALFHKLGSVKTDRDEQESYFSAAYQFLEENRPKDKLAFANCAYDLAVASYHLRSNESARDCMLRALEAYRQTNHARPMDISDTTFALGLIHYALGDLSSAESNFRCDFWHNHDFNQIADRQSSAFNAAAITLQSGSHSDDFLLKCVKAHPCASMNAMLGIYYCKENSFAKAVSPLREAASFYFPPIRAGSLTGATNGTIGPQACDVVFNENEILEDFFKRGSRINEYVSSRFDSSIPFEMTEGVTFDDFHPTTHESDPSFRDVVFVLYPLALRKTGHYLELKEFQSRLRALNYRHEQEYTPGPDQERYLDELRRRLASTWFCPPHESIEQAVVHVRITEDGTLLWNIGTFAGDSKVMSSIATESLAWAAPLPPPPASLANKDIIVVFNAYHCKPIPFQSMMPSTSPLLNKEW